MKLQVGKLLAAVFLVALAAIFSVQIVAAASSDDAANYVRRDPEDYNYLPLILDPNSSTDNTGTLRDIISHNMAYDQGYEVQCAKPDWNITPSVYGAIEEYFEYYTAEVPLRGTAGYNVDFSGGKIPLFRGDEALLDTQKNSSYEGYFGANYLEGDPEAVNSSGVANLLLNQDGQCVAKYENLDSIFGDGAICDKLADSSQCSLSREIVGTTYNTQELYEELAGIFSIRNGDINLSCSDITGDWNEDLLAFGISQSDFNNDIRPAMDALEVMPLNLDILYRLAFLIIAPQQNDITSSDDIFSFLQNRAPQPSGGGGTAGGERHAPIVIGFKVPILATNSILSLPNLRDSALLSAYSIRGVEELQREQESIIAARDELIEKISANKEIKPIINCDGMPQCTGGSDDQALFQALIDIVNGSEQSCGNFLGPYEFAGDLGSPAEVSEDKAFQEPYYTTVLPITNSAGFSWELVVRDENAKQDLAGESVPVSAHLITPYGTNLEYVAESLQSFFTDESFDLTVQNNCIADFNGQCGMIPEYFTFGSITADLDSTTSDSESFLYPPPDVACAGLTNPGEIEACLESIEELSFGASLTEQPREPIRILGASVGWMIQKIQENLREFGSKARDYIEACERTEDLFLGRCLGYQGLPGGADSIAPNSCNDYQGVTVDLPSWIGLQEMVRSIARGNSQDAQLLWGLLQIEGGPMTRQVKDGATSMSCGDLILNTCGASQIAGVIVPACADGDACPGAGFALTDSSVAEAYRQSITTDVACDVRTQLEFILQTRKGQIGELRASYRAANGSDPSTQQLYYMMAGKNYGLGPEYLNQPACAGAPPVSGCGGANYCVCAMDTFPF